MHSILEWRPLGASTSYWLMVANHVLLLAMGLGLGYGVGRLHVQRHV